MCQHKYLSYIDKLTWEDLGYKNENNIWTHCYKYQIYAVKRVTSNYIIKNYQRDW